MHVAKSVAGQQKPSIIITKNVCAFVPRFANYASGCDALGLRVAVSR